MFSHLELDLEFFTKMAEEAESVEVLECLQAVINRTKISIHKAEEHRTQLQDDVNRMTLHAELRGKNLLEQQIHEVEINGNRWPS